MNQSQDFSKVSVFACAETSVELMKALKYKVFESINRYIVGTKLFSHLSINHYIYDTIHYREEVEEM